jgi:hypothetical protein
VAFGEETFKRALWEGLRFSPQPGFIPELARKVPRTDNLDVHGLSHIYAARLSYFDEMGNYLYTEHDVDLSKYWTATTLMVPENTDYLAIYSRVPVRYGYIVAYMKCPDFVGLGYDEWTDLWVGFELGAGESWGIASWVLVVVGGANRLFAHVGGSGLFRPVEQTANLPSDYTTARHGYWVKVNKHQVWFGIDSRIRAIAILAKSGVNRQLYLNSPPYTIFITGFYVPEVQYALLELGGTKGDRYTGVSIELGWGDVRFSEGDPTPPLALPLYVEARDTVMAGQSISSGSLTSHPIPTFGYSLKTLRFMSDKAGSLEIQVYTLSGNWRTYDTISIPAGTLLSYSIDDEVVLARAVFTPSAYPATILEAEVSMS